MLVLLFHWHQLRYSVGVVVPVVPHQWTSMKLAVIVKSQKPYPKSWLTWDLVKSWKNTRTRDRSIGPFSAKKAPTFTSLVEEVNQGVLNRFSESSVSHPLYCGGGVCFFSGRAAYKWNFVDFTICSNFLQNGVAISMSIDVVTHG